MKEFTSPKQKGASAICQHRGCGDRQLQRAQKGTRQFPGRIPISRHHEEQAGVSIIPFLQLLGAHKGHKLQGSQSHLLLGAVPQDILAPAHPRLMLQCCPCVTPVSPGFPVTAEHRDSCAQLLLLWSQPAWEHLRASSARSQSC